VIAQIETDKATMDLTAFEAGTLQEILAPEGTTVAIGKPVARIGEGGGGNSTPPEDQSPTTSSVEEPPTPPSGHQSPSPPEVEAQQDTVVEDNRPPDEVANGKVRASPMARRIAAEHGLDLAEISGSGPQGRVVRADVEAALSGERPSGDKEPPQEAKSAAVEGEGDQRVPLSQMRRTIARRLAEAKRTIPHFYLTTVVDATDLGALRKQINDQVAEAGIKVSFNDLVVKGVALAIRKVPEVNVSFADDALLQHSHVNVGIAVATERGLMVPVIRDADQKSLGQIAREAHELAKRANAGKLQPAEYSGGTFTVSNLGMFGVEQFEAVINPPESAILAVGAITREPAEHNGEIALRDRLRLTLSVDHRALDGAAGARYLQALKGLLEKPMLLLV
jgi:pyruvate dehydrogenase E2 component (dihydrolipoamide acetyltransferase)